MALISKRCITTVAPMLQTISQKIIKPSSETPKPIRRHNLSFMDQMVPNMYNPVAFFYPSLGSTSHRKIAQLLETSLSQTLNYYYPLAGRLVGNECVECNDEGVEVQEVRISCKMSEILNQTDESHTEEVVFPEGLSWNTRSQGSLLVVRLSYFDCGGVAISVCMSHKLADGCSLTTFINDWANVTRQSSHVPSPEFIGPLIFPPVDNPPSMSAYMSENCQTRRYIFNGNEVAKLKAMAADLGTKQPTRVEAVTALLYKCAMASSKANSGSFRPSCLLQPVNLRPLPNPPLSENAVGNFVTVNFISVTEEKDLKFSELVGHMRDSKDKIRHSYREMFKQQDRNLQMQTMAKNYETVHFDNSFDVYFSSGLCGFPLYDVNFGWGKPIWACANRSSIKDSFLLMDTRNVGGIEAVVTLDEQKMSLFERDEELISFVSLKQNE